MSRKRCSECCSVPFSSLSGSVISGKRLRSAKGYVGLTIFSCATERARMQPRIRTAHIVVLALTGALLIALLLWDPAARLGGTQEQDIPDGAAGQAAPREPAAPRSPAPPVPRPRDRTCEPRASKAC